MAAGNFKAFSEGYMHMLDSGDFNSDAIRGVLIDGYTFNQEHTLWSQISGTEVANGNGYATHGLACTCTLSRVNNVITMDVGDLVWTATGSLVFEGIVLVKDANSDGSLAGTDIPLFYADADTGGDDVTATDGDATWTINANGIYTLTLAT